MPLRIAQTMNPDTIWQEMLTEYHTFMTNPKDPWTRANFHYKRPTDKQLLQFKAMANLKIWIHHASGEHYFVYVVGPSDTGGEIKVLVGNLMK